jgi:hypothetical protein
VIDARKGKDKTVVTMLPAFNENAARRNTKKMLGFVGTRLPKKIRVQMVSQKEIEAMLQRAADEHNQAQVQEESTEMPFRTAEEILDKVEELSVRGEALQAEARAIGEELKGTSLHDETTI